MIARAAGEPLASQPGRLRALAAWAIRERFQLAVEITLLAYLLVALTMPVGGMWMPDFGARYLVTENLRWTPGGVEAPIPYPAHELDPERRLLPLPVEEPFAERTDGRYDATVGIWFPLISWLPLRLFGVGGLVILPLLSGLAICVLAGCIAERWRSGRGWLAVLLTAFATPVSFYSQVFWDHTPAVACALAGCYVLLRASQSGTGAQGLLARNALGIALLLAAALLRREMLVAQVVVAVWALAVSIAEHRRAWRLHLANAGLAAAAIALAQAAWIAGSQPVGTLASAAPRLAAGAGFGGAAPAALSSAPRAQGWLELAWNGVLRLVAVVYNTNASLALTTPILGWLTGLAVLLAAASLFLRARWKWIGLAAASVVAAVPAGLNVFSSQDVHSVHGIVLAAPLVLAAMTLASWRAPGAPLLYAAALGFVAAQTVLLGSGPSVALEWGPRVALFVYPVCAIVVAAAALPREAAWRKLAWGAIALLVVCSAATQVRGLGMLRADLGYLSSWTAGLQRLPSMVLASDEWWLPMAVTPAYAHQELVSIRRPDQVRYLYEHVGGRPLAYLGISNQQVPLELGRYFEPVSAQAIAPAAGPPLWVVGLRPRPEPLPASASP
jgi:hypothetical protein